MKFRVVSDLHLEIDPTALHAVLKLSKKEPVDTLILAGDITNYTKANQQLRDISHVLKEHYRNIVYVLGNHEFYNCETNIEETIDMYRNLSKELGFIFLENDSVILDGVKIIGCTMWSNVADVAYNCMSDKYYISREDIIEHHKKSVAFLYENIDTADVVVTHYLPSLKLIDKKYEHYGDLNTAFASVLDPLFEGKNVHWVYGHTHTRNETMLGETKFHCNPFGYPNERMGTYRDLLIEI